MLRPGTRPARAGKLSAWAKRRTVARANPICRRMSGEGLAGRAPPSYLLVKLAPARPARGARGRFGHRAWVGQDSPAGRLLYLAAQGRQAAQAAVDSS